MSEPIVLLSPFGALRHVVFPPSAVTPCGRSADAWPIDRGTRSRGLLPPSCKRCRAAYDAALPTSPKDDRP